MNPTNTTGFSFSTTAANTTGFSIPQRPSPPLNGFIVFSCIIYAFIAALSVIGNLLVIISFFINDKLRTVTNYFVVGLAVADMLVGAISVPLWINTIVGVNSPSAGEIFKFFDTFSGVCSILHLMVISMERYFCVGWAIKHRNTPKYVYYVVLAAVWVTSAFVGSIRLTLITPEFPQADFVLLVFVVFFLFPLVVIVVSYAAIWKIATTRMGNNPTKRSLKREIRTASTIAFVIGFFFVTWSPFFIAATVILYCGLKCYPSAEVTNILKILHYSNSAINPVVYGVRIPEFRKTFKFILKRFYGPITSLCRR